MVSTGAFEPPALAELVVGEVGLELLPQADATSRLAPITAAERTRMGFISSSPVD
jgi:hypothetical protein